MCNDDKGDIARDEIFRYVVEALRKGALPMTRSEEYTLDLAAHTPHAPAYEPEVSVAVRSACPSSPIDAHRCTPSHHASSFVLLPYPPLLASEDNLPPTVVEPVVPVRA